MKKYGIIKNCEYCGGVFETRPRMLRFCSQACKNPNNRPGRTPWNKGKTLSDEQRKLQNRSGLEKGRGWNKGNTTARAREVASYHSERMRHSNPNANGAANNKRPKYKKLYGWEEYVRQVRKFTARTKRRIQRQSNIQFGKYVDDWQIDHIVPLQQGFEMCIPPYIIGSKYNCQILKQKENRSKWNEQQSTDMVELLIKTFLGDYHGVQSKSS